MKKELFDRLVQGLEQAVKIHRGEAKPSRQFVFKSQDVRTIRAKFHKSQAEFARMIGVSLNTLQNWEQGRRQPGPRVAPDRRSRATSRRESAGQAKQAWGL